MIDQNSKWDEKEWEDFYKQMEERFFNDAKVRYHPNQWGNDELDRREAASFAFLNLIERFSKHNRAIDRNIALNNFHITEEDVNEFYDEWYRTHQ